MKLFGGQSVAVCSSDLAFKYWIFKRFKKHFASLHNLDKKVFLFPNTSLDHLSLPQGFRVCRSLNDFKIKTLKGGFQRRPELLAKQVPSRCDSSEIWIEPASYKMDNLRFDRNKRIQGELVEKAVKLCSDINIKCKNNKIDLEEIHQDNKIDLGDIDKCNKSKLVLDIGCGDGSSTKPLLAMGYSCVGVDLNLHSLSEFKSGIKQKKCGQNIDNIQEIKTMRMRNSQSHEVNLSSINYNAGARQMVNDRLSYNNLPQEFLQRSNNSSGLVDVIRWDLRHGLPFKSCTFDLAISISFLQWLFYGERHKQLHLFFSRLKSVLVPQGKSVIQFYPSNTEQLTDSIHCAMKYFQGVVISDYPHVDRGRKLFLVMF